MAVRYLYQPFRFVGESGSSTVAVTEDPDRHLRDKILAVLLTAPGERVNNPEFGVGLRRGVFEGIDNLLLGALRFRIVQGLRRDLGDDVVIDDLAIEPDPDAGEIAILIAYRRTSERDLRQLEVRL
jgi:uncharacterized protein